ncbi:hypothetical protein F5879DRAFT_971846 [Lentinula edodes]|nr:hypothetical protein F5879DRAFT_971846 [Lentinula edodes]
MLFQFCFIVLASSAMGAVLAWYTSLAKQRLKMVKSLTFSQIKFPVFWDVMRLSFELWMVYNSPPGMPFWLIEVVSRRQLLHRIPRAFWLA